MKNNEFNKVTIRNEKTNTVGEFVGTPKAELTTFNETAKAYKDELNSRRIINDNVEAQTLRKDRKTAFTKQDYKKIQQGPTHLASTAGHAVVAATTVTVAAVGAAVGMTLVEESVAETKDLVTFVESEIGADYFNCAFVMDNPYLAYQEQTQEEPVQEQGYNVTVKAVVSDGNGFEESYGCEWDFYRDDEENEDETLLIYYCSIYGLTAETRYSLMLVRTDTYYSFNEETQEENISEIDTTLAARSFETLPIQEFYWGSVIPGADNVEFGLYVNSSLIFVEGSEQDQPMMNFVNVSLFENGEIIQTIQLEGGEDVGGDMLLYYGSFSRLTPSTSYSMTATIESRQGSRTLGSTSFVTEYSEYGFNGITFAEYASYYRHTFTLTLNFYDRQDNPNYSDFTLYLKDDQGQDLQTFTLEATTEVQTCAVDGQEMGDDVTEWAYDLDGTFNYQLDAYDASSGGVVTLATGGPITFIDGDVSEFIGFTNDTFYVSSMQALAKMPVAIDFIDDKHIYEEGFTLTLTYEGAGVTSGGDIVFKAFLNRTLEYQYAELSEETGTEYIETYLGTECKATVTYFDVDTQTDVFLYETYITPVISDSCEFYRGSLGSAYLSENYTSIDIDTIYRSSYGESFVDSNIVLVDEATGEDVASYYVYLDTYPTNYVSIELKGPTSYADQSADFTTYEGLKSALGDRFYTIYLRYKVGDPNDPSSAGEVQQVLISSGISFFFE